MYIKTLGAAAVATLVATGALAQNVNTDADPSAPFSSYRTYSWTPGTPSPVTLTEQRIHSDVEAQMAAKGFKLATDQTPDVYIATHVLTQAEPQIVADGFGPWGFGPGAIDVNTLVKGTLVVDMYDANTKKMVWRGVGTATVSDKASKNNSKIDKSISKMFEHYPPSHN
jgi:uncharacterized protein DUF4136